MDKHVADRWVHALRSGSYQQGKDELRPRPETYCCLGVLCDLYLIEQGKGAWHYGNTGSRHFAVGSDREAAVLPAAVMEWAGMHSTDGCYGAEMSLAAANDGGATFGELADAIEKNWEVL